MTKMVELRMRPELATLRVLLAALLLLGPVGTMGFSQETKEKVRFEIPAESDDLPGVGPIRRYDWFRNLWNKRRSMWADQVDQQQGAVVFLGDSITQGWGEDLSGAFGKLKVANRGISGDTTRGMLLRLEQDVVSLNPKAVVLLAGTNDIEEKATPAQVVSNIELILDRLAAANSTLPVVICQVFPSSADKSRPSQLIKEINYRLLSATANRKYVTVVDTWTLFANEKGDAKPEEFPDLLHPNQVGYSKWKAAIVPVLTTLGLLQRERTQFDFEPGFELLFNGKDLTGWCFRPTTPSQRKARERWQRNNKSAPPWPLVEERLDLDGKEQSPDGRYRVVDGVLVVATPSGGRRIQQLWTQQDFEQDFTLRLDFRATPNADSGVFIRGPQLQCRDYPLAGPYKNLKKFKPFDWNELQIVVAGGVAQCTCNGEIIEKDFKLPASGPIGLEGDRGQLEYRNIRIRMD